MHVESKGKALLLLEDNAERVEAFRKVFGELGGDWQLQLWRDAPTMIAECEGDFDTAHLISLDHDLNAEPGAGEDPGTGLEVAEFLAGYLPICPVIIHSTNVEWAWPMHNELRFAGWTVERVRTIGEDWLVKLWLPKARQLASSQRHREPFCRPPDHGERVERAITSLERLATGDALGETLACRHGEAGRIIVHGLPTGPWFHTDDTKVAISIVDVLKLYGYIHQDALARRFAWRFAQDPNRGYGSMTAMQLAEISRGGDWRKTAASAFSGQDSMGNGSAMRVAPLGGYFADDLERVVAEARASSVITHTHPEGVADAIAVAVAAAVAWQIRGAPQDRAVHLFDAVVQFTPESRVRRGLRKVSRIPVNTPSATVVKVLGNGSLVTAPDTVPFAIWCAANNLDDYRRAITCAIPVGGDCDTNAAIVGGIVVLSAGRNGIPVAWREAEECVFKGRF